MWDVLKCGARRGSSYALRAAIRRRHSIFGRLQCELSRVRRVGTSRLPASPRLWPRPGASPIEEVFSPSTDRVAVDFGHVHSIE